MLKTKPSTRRLSEVARHVVIPEGIVTTGWPDVERKCGEWGDEFDQWQADAGRVILGKRADGLYAATIGGVTLSIARQVAKTFIVGRIVFALCVLFPGLKVLWTAHHTATLGNTFRSLLGFARRKSVAPYILATRRGSGKEAIEFRNGSVIYFGARSQGFGRGFDEVDVEVFDEAQILDAKALEDMVAATNQCRHPHGALLFYMGTPPRPLDPGEEFTDRRRKALVAKSDGHGVVESGEAIYIECSADPNTGRPGGPSLDSIEQLKKANPSYPHRTPLASVKRLRANLKSDDSWRREGLGIWDGDNIARVVEAGQWNVLKTKTPPTEGRVTYGVKFSPDGSTVALAVCRRTDTGPPHVELVEHRSMSAGLGWLVAWLVERQDNAVQIVIDGKAHAGALVEALRAAKVPARVIWTPTTDQVITAHSMVLLAIQSKEITHFAQPGLDGSVALAGKRLIGTNGGWGWKPLADGDVTPIEAVTFAHWGAMTSKRRPGRKTRGRVLA